MSQKTNIYVLKLKGGNYYVGLTEGEPEKRILQHFQVDLFIELRLYIVSSGFIS